MARTWNIVKVINGKSCRLHYAEWEYLGGSIIQTVTTEIIDEKDNTKNIVTDKKGQGDNFEQSKK